MDLIKLLFANSSISIRDDQTGFVKWPRMNVISADIMAATAVTDMPMSGTPVQVVGVYQNAIYNNLKSVKVIMPAALSLNVIVSDVSTAESIIQAWKSKESTFSITSRSIISNNMALVNFSFRQDANNISAIVGTLSFEQTVESMISNFNPKQSADRDTVGITTKAPESLTSTVSSFYNNVTSKIGFLS